MPRRHAIALGLAAALLQLAALVAPPGTTEDATPLAAPRRAAAQPAPGAPIAYAYDATYGQTGVPWQRGSGAFNQPWGIGGDREGLWIANGAGRNLLRFGSGSLEELGRAGDLDALAGHPVRFPADVAVVVHDLVPPGPGLFPRRTVWLTDQGGHTAIGIPLDQSGQPGTPMVLGMPDVPGDDDAHFRGPVGIAADGSAIYVSDAGNHRVQVFAPTGALLATIGQSGVAGAGPGQLDRPARLGLGPERRLYIADAGNHRVVAYDVADPRAPREVQRYGRGGAPGSGDDAFDTPLGVHADGTFLYVADSGNRRVQMFRWRTGAYWRTLDGMSEGGCSPLGGGSVPWDLVSDVAQDVDGYLHVAQPLRMVVVRCDVFTQYARAVRGRGAAGVPYAAREELHNAPFGVAVASDGTVAVVEGEGHRVVARRPDGRAAWVAGRAGVAGAGAGSDVRFDGPSAAAYLADGRLVVADAGNGRLVVLDAFGRQDAIWGAGDLAMPVAVAVLPDGSLAVADAAAGRMRRLDAAGIVTGDLAGPGGVLAFAEPAGVAVDAAGTWYVAERAAHVVRVVDSAGRLVRTLGMPGVAGDDFGHLDRPSGLAVDAAGRLFVADTGNHRVQVFGADGAYLTTIGGRRGAGMGGFIEPRGVAIGADGRVYVADTYNHRIQAFAAATAPWRPEAINGFGQRQIEAVEALAELGGWLYAGTRSASGATIHRRQGDGPWETVVAGGLGDAANQAVIALAPHDGALYSGVENAVATGATDPLSGAPIEVSAGGALWRSQDGVRWDAVVVDGFGDARQSGIGPLLSFGGQLYAGTRSIDRETAPQLWRSATGDAGTWQRVRIDLGVGWSGNEAVAALGVHSGALLAGTCAPSGAQVWRSDDGQAWRAVGQLEPGGDPRDALPHFGDGTPCLTGFASFEGHLYAALGTDPRVGARFGMHVQESTRGLSGWAAQLSPPVALWRCAQCDGTDWQPVAAPGFGDGRNRGALAVAAFDEPPFRYLYAFAGNPADGLSVWRAMDGLDWESVVSGGLGDANNAGPGSGPAALVYRNRLVVGTRNAANGGEIWSTGGTRPGAVPTRPGAATPTATPRPSPQPPTGRARYRQVGSWPIAVAGQPDVFGSPIDLALASDGTVYILDGAPGGVLSLRPDDTWGAPFGGVGNGPERITRPGALALDELAGQLYASDLGTERLLAFDRQGNFMRTVLYRASIVDIAVRSDGSLWLADVRAGAVRRVAPDGAEIERFGRYGLVGDDGLEGLVAVAEEPGGRLWIADDDGARLRAYDRNAVGAWSLIRTLDLNAASLAGCNGRRLQVLRSDVLLAGRCVLEDGKRLDVFPNDHRGSDLYGTTLHTALPSAGHYVALARYSLDPLATANSESAGVAAVVRYQDEGFDIVVGFTVGGTATSAFSAEAGEERLEAPSRLDVLPGGDVVVMDASALRGPAPGPTPPASFRRFSPEGRPLDLLAIRNFPSRSLQLQMLARLTLATGEPGRMIGVAYQQGGSARLEIVTLADTIRRRYCFRREDDGRPECLWGVFTDPVWDTTLVNLGQSRGAQDYNYAATLEHTRSRYWLLQVWADEPLDTAMPARLFRFDVDGYGRKTAIPLDGTEREAMWTDVDAGPDGRVVVLDVLNDRVQVLDADGNRLHQLPTPKDAWKVAAGPNGEVFVLTQNGYVVRMAADGTVLSRFVGLSNDLAPPTALSDLGVDAWGRVYTIDTLYSQVTVFEPEGTEDEVLQGERCTLGGDKWAAPDEVLLGDTAQLHLALFGTCGFVEESADIVLMVNAKQGTPSEAARLRAARQVFAIIDLDRHRVGLGRYVLNGTIDEPLTQDRTRLIRALYDVPTGQPRCGTNTLSALSTARDMFQDTPPGRRRLLVLIHPDREKGPTKSPADRCWPAWTVLPVRRLAAELEAEGVTIVSVNGSTAACTSATTCNIPVAERGQGTGRRAISASITRQWPPSLAQAGSLVDQLPANIDYVPGSASPPAAWNAALRTLTWDLRDVPLGAAPRFALTIRPRQEGYWPTNVRAAADIVDGWGRAQQVVLPVPRIRVYGERPPTPTFTPTIPPTPAPTDTPEPTPTSRPGTIYLPLALRTDACEPDTQSADVALLIDTSGSMAETTSPGGPTKLDAAREGARAFLAQLSPGRDQAALIPFNAEATVLAPLTGDIAAVSAALDQLAQATGTRIDAALDAGRAELTGPARRAENNAVLILLTDGEPTGTTPEAVQAAAERAKADGLLVFTIGLGADVDAALLEAVASRSDWYYPAPDARDLAAIYGRIAYAIPCRGMWP